jgi:hypothetical protein
MSFRKYDSTKNLVKHKTVFSDSVVTDNIVTDSISIGLSNITGILYLNQSTTPIGVASNNSTSMCIGGFAATSYSCQQCVLPFDCIVYAATFLSDNGPQDTEANITLQICGGSMNGLELDVQEVTVNCPAGLAVDSYYRSLQGTVNKYLKANNAWYCQIYSDTNSTNAKNWNVMLFYKQI